MITLTEQNIVEVSVQRVDGECVILPNRHERDALAVEEPLEIVLGFDSGDGRKRQTISITMRTPGEDAELAVGFLFAEGIVRRAEDVKRVLHCGAPLEESGTRNTIRVDLRDGVAVDMRRLERHFYTTSSCGVCGKTSIEALETVACAPLAQEHPVFAASIIHRLPSALREAQSVFTRTGGLHAAALFDEDGKMHGLREDVGRHNAIDKLIGGQLLKGQMPLSNRLILLSGRASFELVQKALVAGAPVVAAVGAPSSLAVDLARSRGMTLLGFVRDNRFNIYAGPERIGGSGRRT